MCGRYTLTDTGQLLEELQVAPGGPELTARYNIAPTQQVAAVHQEPDGTRRLGLFRWGLVPFWADDLRIGNKLINARSETAATKPSFRHAFKRRRCLIPVDGFYEWKKVEGGKQPVHIHLGGRRPFTFAGLWEVWRKGEQPVQSCTILTTSASPVISPVHHRMPVVLEGEERDRWLDPAADPASLGELMRPSGLPFELTPVSKLVNNPRHDTPRCLDPVQL